jgi:hypothetical protein
VSLPLPWDWNSQVQDSKQFNTVEAVAVEEAVPDGLLYLKVLAVTPEIVAVALNEVGMLNAPAMSIESPLENPWSAEVVTVVTLFTLSNLVIVKLLEELTPETTTLLLTRNP